MLLSIITRHIAQRIMGFERLVKSLLAQTSQDFEHIVIHNELLGLYDANCSFARHKEEPIGDYIFMIDDDDYISDPQFVAELSGMVVDNPDLVQVRINWKGVLSPNNEYWELLKSGGHPIQGRTGTPGFVLRRDIWYRYIDAFGSKSPEGDIYGGDYRFIAAVYDGELALKINFWDKIIATVDSVGKDSGRYWEENNK